MTLILSNTHVTAKRGHICPMHVPRSILSCLRGVRECLSQKSFLIYTLDKPGSTILTCDSLAIFSSKPQQVLAVLIKENLVLKY